MSEDSIVTIKEDTELYAVMTERNEALGGINFHLYVLNAKSTLCGMDCRHLVDCGFQGYLKDAKAGCLRCQKSIEKWKRIVFTTCTDKKGSGK